MRVNARETEFEAVELFGKPALFTANRIDATTIPENLYYYDLRGSDHDPGHPATIEPYVAVNHAGTILSAAYVKLPSKSKSRPLKNSLDFLGETKTLTEYCREQNITLPSESQFKLRPASPDEAGIFYALPPEKDAELGAIGHVRMDFGRSGNEFWHTWWPRGNEALNTPEFKEELSMVVDELRMFGPLKNIAAMRSFCNDHGGELDGSSPNYGYVVETERYRYCLRCNPLQGDYNAYLTAFDLRVREMNLEKPVIGTVSFASGETLAYTDPDIFLQVIRDELPYRPTSGFQYTVLTDDPAVRKGADDILYDLFGEENPRPLADYGLTEQGHKALLDAENPNLAHKYDWFVVENFNRDGEVRHDLESLTGAIDKFNGLDCESKRLCVTKDAVSTIYLAVAENGETALDKSWRENPRFSADALIEEAAERLQLSIAGLESTNPTMMLGGM